jgi:hypothetical protein
MKHPFSSLFNNRVNSLLNLLVKMATSTMTVVEKTASGREVRNQNKIAWLLVHMGCC